MGAVFTESRFWALVSKSPDGCWLWTGHVQPMRGTRCGGYGKFHAVAIRERASRTVLRGSLRTARSRREWTSFTPATRVRVAARRIFIWAQTRTTLATECSAGVMVGQSVAVRATGTPNFQARTLQKYFGFGMREVLLKRKLANASASPSRASVAASNNAAKTVP